MIVLDRTIYTATAVNAVRQAWQAQGESLPLIEDDTGWRLADESLDRTRLGDMLNDLLRRSLLDHLQAEASCPA